MELPEKWEQEIITKLMAERQVKVGPYTFLLSMFCGENQLLPVNPDTLEAWKAEIVEEALRRINEQAAVQLRQAPEGKYD